MWIILILIIIFLIVRGIYFSGEFIVIDRLGMIWIRGSYKTCKSWLKQRGVWNDPFYIIKRI